MIEKILLMNQKKNKKKNHKLFLKILRKKNLRKNKPPIMLSMLRMKNHRNLKTLRNNQVRKTNLIVNQNFFLLVLIKRVRKKKFLKKNTVPILQRFKAMKLTHLLPKKNLIQKIEQLNHLKIIVLKKNKKIFLKNQFKNLFMQKNLKIKNQKVKTLNKMKSDKMIIKRIFRK